MAKDGQEDRTYNRLIDAGLKDPFIRGVAGVVVIAAAASFAMSALGSGPKAVIALALSLAFGVVLVVLRTLMKYVDSAFVRIICFISSGVIMAVFLTFAVLLVPAAVICWPQPYTELIGLPNCSAITAAEEPVFEPIPFTGSAITFNTDNQKYLVLVFYRPGRREDARHIVGALLSAGYRSNGSLSSLEEVITPNRNPNTTLVKTTALARPVVEAVANVVRIAVPVKAETVILFPEDAPLQRGNIQIALF
jgi:hypothetical protein